MKRGFTLIEMLVSVAIFTVVMVVALGALLSLSTADRKAQTLKSSVDNLNFAIDSMSRSIRTGYSYNCGSASGGDCATGSNEFVFTANTGVVTYYRLESAATDSAANAAAACAQTSPNIGCLQRSTDNGATWSAITAPDVVIQGQSTNCPVTPVFYVLGSQVGLADNRQPIVVVTLCGYAQVSTTQQSTFHLQTSITQRIYDQ